MSIDFYSNSRYCNSIKVKRKMFLVGLTGGVAAGKSSAANIFRELGVPVIDADAIAREIVEPGEPAYLEIK